MIHQPSIFMHTYAHRCDTKVYLTLSLPMWLVVSTPLNNIIHFAITISKWSRHKQTLEPPARAEQPWTKISRAESWGFQWKNCSSIIVHPKVSVAFRRLRGQVGIRVFVSRTCGWKVSYGDTPKSSKPLDNFHSETNGDLGIPHFKATPKFKRAWIK